MQRQDSGLLHLSPLPNLYSLDKPRTLTGWPRLSPGGSRRPAREPSTFRKEHGHLVANYAVGFAVGVARKAELVFVPRGPSGLRAEGFLEALMIICNDITDEDTDPTRSQPKHKDTGVVNVYGGFKFDKNDTSTRVIGKFCNLCRDRHEAP